LLETDTVSLLALEKPVVEAPSPWTAPLPLEVLDPVTSMVGKKPARAVVMSALA